MRPSVLVVDDDVRIVEDIKTFLRDLPERKKRHYGIDEFVLSEADDGETAIKLLQQAKDSSSPFSLVLLDLGLPWNTENDNLESPKVGFEILKYIIEQNAAIGVIIVSKFDEYKDVVKAFPHVTVNFISKPLSAEVLQQPVLNYFEREGVRILEQRIKKLIPFEQKDLEDHLGRCFSGFVQTVIIETEALAKGFNDRWGLDIKTDTHDRHVRHLATLDKAAKNAMGDWRKIQSAFMRGDEQLVEYNLAKGLREIEAEVLPSLMLKNVEMKSACEGGIRIKSFKDDAKCVLSEIILGALIKLPNHDSSEGRVWTGTIEASVKAREGFADVNLEDNFESIPHDAAEVINEGRDVIRGGDFSREWGLSLAQLAARRGGGNLIVEPKRGRGNIVTYRIPLVHHE